MKYITCMYLKIEQHELQVLRQGRQFLLHELLNSHGRFYQFNMVDKPFI
jgi:hypothetical protein